MRKLTVTLLIVTLSLLAAATCAAQRRGKSRKPRPGGLKEISVIGPASGSFSTRAGAADVTYLSDADETSVSVVLDRVYAQQRKYFIGLNASYTVKGKKISKPDAVQLSVYYLPKFRALAKPLELVVESDAGRFDFGTMELGQTQRLDFVNNVTWDGQTKAVDYAAFESVVGGKSVTLRLAGIAFEVKGRQLEALRDLVRAVER